MYWVGVQMLCVVLVTSGHHICDTPNSVYRIPGDAIVTGFFGAHSGANCSMVEPMGLQMMQSVISAVEAIRNNNFIPGIHIGLSLYDTCSLEEMAQKSIVSAMVDAECKQEYVLGGLTSQGIGGHVDELATSLGLPLTRVGGPVNTTLLIKLAAIVAHDIGWNPINYVVSSNDEVSEEFVNSASTVGLCIQRSLNIRDLDKIDQNAVVVVFAEGDEMKDILPSLTNHKVLLVPLNGEYTSYPDIGESTVFVMVVTSLTPSVTLRNPYNVTEEFVSLDRPENIRSKSTVQQVQILSDILRLVTSFKSQLATHCPSDTEWNLCPRLPRPAAAHGRTDMANARLVASALKFLSVPELDFEAFALLQQTESSLEKVGSVGLEGVEWALRTEFNTTEEEMKCREGNETEGIDCTKCSNYDQLMRKYVGADWDIPIVLKDDAWVAALLSISAVGVLCCFAIAVFILVRLCKQDILEGNPGFSLIVLFSLVVMYCSVLPFSINIVSQHYYYSGILCGVRVFSTSLSYSLVFSVMLARSMLLASCDRDGGLMSHVSGYLQTALCFFMALVQVALSLQFWTVNWVVLSREQCVSMSHGWLFLLLLSYDAFLLLLLICVAPFIAKSKRNYREGAYFGVASVLCLLVWAGWITAYCLAPPRWNDFIISSGLVGTATCILVSVFIPRTYLMLSGIVRDHLVSTLPSLAHTTSTSIVDVNYRSTQALYDSVHPSRGHVNPNFYADRPTTPSTSRMESRVAHHKTPDNTYERYGTPPSPHHVTRF